MKKFSSIFVFAALAMTQLAHAGDGQITVTGTVVSSTCKINGVQQNGSTVSNMSISLGTVAAANFAEAGKVGGVVTGATTQGFNVALTGCPIASTVSLVLDGTGSIDVASRSFRNTATTGAAMNMNAQIVNAEAGVNTVLFPSSGSGISKTTDASGNANFLLGARFLSTGTATAGSFSTVAGFSVVYN
jgi:major type 1 subunit fimbrin (pilin)